MARLVLLSRNDMRAAVLATLALAFAVRLALGLALLRQGDSAYILASDDGDAYVTSARWAAFHEPVVLTGRLAQKWPTAAYDPDPTTRWPPAYWLVLAAQYRLFSYQHLSAILLQALLGAAAVWAVYRIAQHLLPNGWALATALLAALSSTQIYLSATVSAEALFIPLLLVALELTLHQTRPAAFVAGAILGLAEATRPLALPLVLLFSFYQSTPRRLALTLAGFAIVLLPLVALDPHLLTAGAAEALRDSLAQAPPLATRLSMLFLTGGWSPVGDPLIPPTAAPALHLLFWTMAAAGALSLGRHRPALLLLGTAAVLLLPALTVALPLVRYRAAADPLFLLWFVAGVRATTQLMDKLRREAPATPAAAH